ncbi:hypothetical protein L4C42_09370 [Vibrio wakamikoensis]|uniref:hypothetical protein n=1 Tax=Vibrio wakamikoensis TaxID=2910251 RepID=UPI003D24F2A1
MERFFQITNKYRRLALFGWCMTSIANAQPLEKLNILQSDYPKAIYFRYVEGSAANPNIPYERWEKRWSKLDGMIVKALDEEVPGRSGEAQRKFIKYKQRNPQKLMLLHFNGNARDPNYRPSDYPARAWTYFVGTYSQQPLARNTQTIRVDDTDVFRVNHGKRAKYNDDVAIVPLTENKELNWAQAEQVQLLSINPVQSTITVKRSQYGTKARDYKNGVYLAPHVAQAPYKKSSTQSLWRYNFANLDTKEAPSLILANELLSLFKSGQALESFDGIAFDVLADSRGRKHHSRQTPIDYHLDGKFNQLDIHAQSQYRLGVKQLLQKLRHSFGDNKILIADGNQLSQQREITLLNGIESEEWPNYGDPDLNQWSTGINRHRYWTQFSRTPSLNVIKIGLPNPSQNYNQEGIRKLKVAAALLTDAVISPAYKSNGKALHKWPELHSNGHYDWLGKPITPMKYYTVESKARVLISESKPRIDFTKPSILLKRKGRTIKHSIDIELTEPSGVVISAEVMSHSTLAKDRISYLTLTQQEDINLKASSWTGSSPFIARFYFDNLPKGTTTLILESDAEYVTIKNLKITPGAEIAYRLFDNGIIIANPTTNALTLPDNFLPETKIPRPLRIAKKSAKLIKVKNR